MIFACFREGAHFGRRFELHYSAYDDPRAGSRRASPFDAAGLRMQYSAGGRIRAQRFEVSGARPEDDAAQEHPAQKLPCKSLSEAVWDGAPFASAEDKRVGARRVRRADGPTRRAVRDTSGASCVRRARREQAKQLIPSQGVAGVVTVNRSFQPRGHGENVGGPAGISVRIS